MKDGTLDITSFLTRYWADVAAQNAEELQKYFHPEACIRWHDSNEQFTVEEFITANCECPGSWEILPSLFNLEEC